MIYTALTPSNSYSNALPVPTFTGFRRVADDGKRFLKRGRFFLGAEGVNWYLNQTACARGSQNRSGARQRGAGSEAGG